MTLIESHLQNHRCLQNSNDRLARRFYGAHYVLVDSHVPGHSGDCATQTLEFPDKGIVIAYLASRARKENEMPCALLDQPGSDGATQPAESTHEEICAISPKAQLIIACLRRKLRVVMGYAHNKLSYVVSFLHGSDRLRNCAGTERLQGVNRLNMALLIELDGATQEADHVVSITNQGKTHLARPRRRILELLVALLITYLFVTRGRSSPRCDRSKPTNVRFDRNPSIASFPWPTKSRRPISTNVPNSATQFQEACRSSPDRALRTTSTPLLPVACLMSDRKLASRELKILWRGIPKFAVRKSIFSWVPTVQ